MKLSLRKANALQVLIQEGIDERFVGIATINKFEDPSSVIEAAGKELILTIGKKFDLIDVLFSIRKKVGKAGADAGIADLLTDLALNEKQSAFFKQLASTTQFAVPVEQVQSALEELRKDTTQSGYRRESISVGLLNKETVDKYKSAINKLRKQKQDISDKLLHLNVSTEIELDATEVQVLKQYEIL